MAERKGEPIRVLSIQDGAEVARFNGIKDPTLLDAIRYTTEINRAMTDQLAACDLPAWDVTDVDGNSGKDPVFDRETTVNFWREFGRSEDEIRRQTEWFSQLYPGW